MEKQQRRSDSSSGRASSLSVLGPVRPCSAPRLALSLILSLPRSLLSPSLTQLPRAFSLFEGKQRNMLLFLTACAHDGDHEAGSGREEGMRMMKEERVAAVSVLSARPCSRVSSALHLLLLFPRFIFTKTRRGWHMGAYEGDERTEDTRRGEEKERKKENTCCVALHGKDLFDAIQERSSESYKTVLHICKGLYLADGIIVNSFLDLEREAITSLQENHKYPPIYAVGPILKTESTTLNVSASKCLKWLENQPPNSVIYVSFGSGGTLSQDQLNELALGLEMSGHKFLWVLRAPSGSSSSAYLNPQNEDPLDFLPKGFIGRTKDQGFVVTSWAPQVEILRHDSTGGFLTHCGWNSILESVFYSGKPIIVWPLFAEQRMNAIMLMEVFKVALWPKADENKNNNGIIVKEEVARVVKLIMEGEEGNELRRRVQVFQDDATKALSEEGSSARTISSLTHELKYMSGM